MADLLKTPENKTLEFKRDASSPEGLLRTLVAFVNTAGGTLILGVEDKTHAVKGIEDPLALEERLSNLISDNIQPKLIPDIEVIPWRNTYLLAVSVYPSSYRPHFLKSLGLTKGVYIRIGSSNRQADHTLITELQRTARGNSFDEQPIPELNSEAIDFRVISELFAEYRKIKTKDLQILHLATPYQKRLVPTAAGIILFGKDRQRYFPDAWLQVGRFSGTTRTHILDSAEIHSYPILAINEAIQFVEKHTTRAIKIGRMKRTEYPSIPVVAVREAIINAVAHADYSQRGSPIRIAIYDNRLEIDNPGLIPFNLTIEDLYQGISKLRNPIIARIFHDLKLIEKWGSGIRRMIESCEKAGLEKPLLEEIGTHFRVTIFLTVKSKPKLSAANNKILSLFKENEGLSTQQVAQKMKLSTRAVRLRLLNLIAQGLLVEIGSSPQDPYKKYFLVKSM